MRRLLLACLFLPAAALAQSVPNGGSISAGQVWTPTQWQAAWQSKLDTNNPILSQVGGGSSSSFNSTFPGTGTAIGFYNNGNMVYGAADTAHNVMVDLATALPNGSNTIGAVTQGGSWTVNITGAVPLPNGAAQNQYTGGIYNATPPVLSSGQQTALQVDPNGNLKVNVVAGGGGGGSGGGTASSYNSTFPITGTAIGVKNGANMVNLTADNSSNLNVDLQTPLPVGSNVIGGVTQSGTWTVGLGTSIPTGSNTIGAVTQSGSWSVSLTGGIPLPSGAASAALQGTVQGPVAPGTAAANSTLIGGVFNTAAPSLTNGQQAAAQLDASGNLKVNVVSGGGTGGTSSTYNTTFPGVGTAIGAKNSGNMVPLAADGSGNLNINVAVPLPAGSNVIGSVSQNGSWNFNLPTGASTAANQTATQGPVAPGTAATASTLIGGVFNSTSPTLTTGQQAALQTDSSGNLKVNIVAGAASGGTSSAFGSAFPTAGTAIGAKNGTNMVSVAADAAGNLDVNLQTAIPAGSNTIGSVTQSGTWTVATNADQSATAGTAASKALLGGGVYNSSAPTLTNGQGAAIQMDSNGNTKVTCVSGCATGAASNASSGVATSSANTPAVSYLYAFNGTTWDQLQDDASKNLKVNVTTPLPAGSNTVGAVTQSGTWNVGLSAGSNTVGSVNQAGTWVETPFASSTNAVSGTATATTATNTSIIAAQGAGNKIYMTGFSCYNSGTTTSTLLFTSGSGGSTIWATILPAGSGSNGTISPPVATAANTALFMTTGSASTTMSCSVTGFKGT